MKGTAETGRLYDDSQRRDWKKWGPYLSERQWGTVREDYSPDGSAWEYFSHDQARSRAYRWGEDGIMGFCDMEQYLCFCVGMWNEKDPIIKERLFGLTGNQGNHGEDVKEYYYYLDSTPTHSYVKMLYKYPQGEYPYHNLIEENMRRGRQKPGYNLIDTGLFDENKYFDVFTEYAKTDPDDLCIKITVWNRGPEDAHIHMLPQAWYRNYWTYDRRLPKPSLFEAADKSCVEFKHPSSALGTMYLYYEHHPALLFCDNETNHHKVYGHKEKPGYWKDGVNDYVVQGKTKAVNPDHKGTKVALKYSFNIKAGQCEVIRLRLTKHKTGDAFGDFDQVVEARTKESDDFYDKIAGKIKNEDVRRVQRQAFAGLLSTKQFYYFDINKWMDGDPGTTPPEGRKFGRNKEWRHLNNMDIISMPDKWEYPWYAAWDLAFHMVPFSIVDPDFAKKQLILFLREWYMHPNGQIPAYEWHFSDVNPPVHAWACWKVYEMESKIYGKKDTLFLQRVFQKLLLNFTWWVNRKDSEGNNVFEGGFLGLDNIGVFDRSRPLPTGGTLEQADGTSWMAMYSLNMTRIALELAVENSAYEDMASKFLEHFLFIAGAVNNLSDGPLNMWDEEDGFFYDVLNMHNGEFIPLKIRSMVGLIPLYATETLEPELINKLPHFKRRLEWFFNYRPEFSRLISTWNNPEAGIRRRFSLLKGNRLKRVVSRMLDETEFLSDYGIRALSKYHKEHPYVFTTETNEVFSVAYNPGESDSGMFGGNSNWRGPIWFPVNYLIIESLFKFYEYYGDDVTVEYPTGSGTLLNYKEVALELSKRLLRLFVRNAEGKRPVFGERDKLQTDPHFKDYILFYEYFHGDSGSGLGASHQTGWTALIAELIFSHYEEDWADDIFNYTSKAAEVNK